MVRVAGGAQVASLVALRSGYRNLGLVSRTILFYNYHKSPLAVITNRKKRFFSSIIRSIEDDTKKQFLIQVGDHNERQVGSIESRLVSSLWIRSGYSHSKKKENRVNDLIQVGSALI